MESEISSAPDRTSTAPSTICHVIFSFKNITESKTANTREDLSIVTTLVAGPMDRALKEKMVESVVAIPAKINKIQSLFSISFSEENLP